MVRRSSVTALALLALLACAACRVDVAVVVEVREDGGGTVEAAVALDREAVAEVGDAATLRADDLRAAGWVVAATPTAGADGSATLSAAKAFATPEEADRVLDELSGPDGPFGSLALTRTRTVFETRTAFEGEVDLTAGVGAFGDAELRRLLGSEAPEDPAELGRVLGAELERIVAVSLEARLPEAPPTVVRPAFGARQAVRATSVVRNATGVVAAGVSAATAFALVALVAVRLVRRRRRRRRRGA